MTGVPGRKEADPGVPEALPRTLIRLREEVGVEFIDRLWIFPPVRRGRKEQGLIAVSTFQGDEDRRGMLTVSYRAEHTGRGVTVEPTLTDQGEAPPDRFPPVMRGVVRRADEEGEEAREVDISASAQKFEELMEEFDDVFIEAPET
ncbi:MAG: hypothetical protein R3253_12265 [Longimicrobiales bacterium]|nr:hypothetical protein [Longimicrobiales bacterium]